MISAIGLSPWSASERRFFQDPVRISEKKSQYFSMGRKGKANKPACLSFYLTQKTIFFIVVMMPEW